MLRTELARNERIASLVETYPMVKAAVFFSRFQSYPYKQLSPGAYFLFYSHDPLVWVDPILNFVQMESVGCVSFVYLLF